ncbi:GntR family transcriptional regulator [Desmospora profundinema]|uniref:GntR family transcriptional regulator n=1 Tax=Desmospora profundinema TaxID=1571184 RepID=A0ABU1IH66_9BACL|nr:GntR family transcriptional regulator [Desmospora profundinema]MDR6224120.1 GntR family transcriptional regulator [Desmospora profundinema]
MNTKMMGRVSKQSPIPLYYQLKEILQAMIDNEEFKPGDAFPPERELCEIHGISRMTARKAVMALVNEGVLYREQGKGTYVAKPKPKHLLTKLRGFTDEMEEKGLTVDTSILSFETVEATLNLRKNLKMKEHQDRAVEIKRLRMVDGAPFALETVWLNQAMVPGLSREWLEGGSLYTVLKQQYRYQPSYARQTIEPIQLNEFESGLLGLEPDSLALLFRRTTFLENEEIMEYTKCIYRSDQYKYEVILQP